MTLIGKEKKGAFARRAGISPISLSGYLAGKPPSRNALIKIARATGATIDHILGMDSLMEGNDAPTVRDAQETWKNVDQLRIILIREIIEAAPEFDDKEVEELIRKERIMRRFSKSKKGWRKSED